MLLSGRRVYEMATRRSSPSTLSPATIVIRSTFPDIGAGITVSIFIADRTTSGCRGIGGEGEAETEVAEVVVVAGKVVAVVGVAAARHLALLDRVADLDLRLDDDARHRRAHAALLDARLLAHRVRRVDVEVEDVELPQLAVDGERDVAHARRVRLRDRHHLDEERAAVEGNAG